MKNIVEFPNKKAERDRNGVKLDLVSGCQAPLATCIKAMRELGADSGQIANMLKLAAYELERDGDEVAAVVLSPTRWPVAITEAFTVVMVGQSARASDCWRTNAGIANLCEGRGALGIHSCGAQAVRDEQDNILGLLRVGGEW